MDTDKDIKLAVGWNRINLKLVGIWPEPTMSEDPLSKYKSLISLLFMVAFISAPQCINLFLLNGDLALITENLSLANIPSTGAVLKLLFTWYRKEDLKSLVKSFYDDWHDKKTEDERSTMLNSAKMSKQISTWCTVLTLMMLTVYLMLRSVEIANSDRIKVNQDRLVLYPGYFPYNVRPTTTMVLTNLAQVIAAYCATCSYTSVDTFIAMLILHTCGQFKNLRMRLHRLMNKEGGTRSDDEIQEELVWIVKRHEHLNW